jgi:hypothetical protein
MPIGTHHLTLSKQRAFIQGHGTNAVVFPTVTCPCLTLDLQPDPNDAACGGTGRLLVPDAQYTTMLLIQGDTSHKSYLEPGTWVDGTIRATTLPEIVLGDRDRIRLVDVQELFDEEVLLRGVQDTLRFSAGITVQYVTDRLTVYRPGVEYALTPPNRITWLAGGRAPAVGTFYSVRYFAQPEYLVFLDMPKLRVEHRTAQSQVVTLRRLDHLTHEVSP